MQNLMGSITKPVSALACNECARKHTSVVVVVSHTGRIAFRLSNHSCTVYKDTAVFTAKSPAVIAGQTALYIFYVYQ